MAKKKPVHIATDSGEDLCRGEHKIVDQMSILGEEIDCVHVERVSKDHYSGAIQLTTGGRIELTFETRRGRSTGLVVTAEWL